MSEKSRAAATKADLVLNAVGERCPMPIINLRDNLKEAKVGQTIELIADDIGAKADVPAFCKRTGNELLGSWDDKGTLHFLIRKMK
jgi:tRNA 2-thiouridine synthesizing protein A